MKEITHNVNRINGMLVKRFQCRMSDDFVRRIINPLVFYDAKGQEILILSSVHIWVKYVINVSGLRRKVVDIFTA